MKERILERQELKELILSLIKDDLLHHKLILSLNDAGLNANAYRLNLSDSIFELMGINDSPETEFVFQDYLSHLKKVRHVELSFDNYELDEVAEELYHFLEQQR